MFTRRSFLLASALAVSAPFVARGQNAGMADGDGHDLGVMHNGWALFFTYSGDFGLMLLIFASIAGLAIR